MIENIHIEYFNDKLAAPNATFKFFKYNRTQFAINASIWVLEDLDGRDIEASTKIFVFLSNTFKFFGVELKAPNVCTMWKDDLYGIREIMTKCGDVDLCNIKKGLWQLTNCWPAASIKYFPKSVPQGSYKVTMESKLKDGRVLARIALYGKASLYFKDIQNMNNTSKYNIFQ
ncbi:uncharacterized protein LOC114334917 [Diabrotica virgifera virgifera]|uniref:Uncharacterized protein n=1 Tax=Diabrotica virgifera virgifera TaxID=50390 RepID=A0ABM5KDT9_DIAVI|nr:uncharacterized protein LOC114334917 [Diabrotica virgifera virgifera]